MTLKYFLVKIRCWNSYYLPHLRICRLCRLPDLRLLQSSSSSSSAAAAAATTFRWREPHPARPRAVWDSGDLGSIFLLRSSRCGQHKTPGSVPEVGRGDGVPSRTDQVHGGGQHRESDRRRQIRQLRPHRQDLHLSRRILHWGKEGRKSCRLDTLFGNLTIIVNTDRLRLSSDGRRWIIIHTGIHENISYYHIFLHACSWSGYSYLWPRLLRGQWSTSWVGASVRQAAGRKDYTT